MTFTPEMERSLAAHEATYWWHVVKRRFLRTILERFRLPSAPDQWVLDVGAAGGHSREIFSPAPKLVLLETVNHVEFRNAPEQRKVVALAGALPFRSGSFDLATAADVLEHIKDDLAATTEIHRIIKPGGHFLASVPAWQSFFSAHDVALGHFRRYSPEAFRTLLTRAGFTVRFQTAIFLSLFPFSLIRPFFAPPTTPNPKTIYPGQNPFINWLCALWFRWELFLVRYARLPLGASDAVLGRK